MAGLFDEQSKLYASARPSYSPDWYSKLASLTPHHILAWDVGTGNGQAAVGVAEHFEQVIATDVSEAQLRRATPHPKVRYVHTPLATTDDALVSILGGERTVDLITVAQAAHWLDLPRFYSVVSRVLRRTGGILAVWGYNDAEVSPAFDEVFRRFHATTLPYWDPRIQYLFDGYRSLPFPFESVGVGSAGQPVVLDLEKEVSFDGFLAMVRSWSALFTAREKGVDLLNERVVEELRSAWNDSGNGSGLVRKIKYKSFMLAGKPSKD